MRQHTRMTLGRYICLYACVLERYRTADSGSYERYKTCCVDGLFSGGFKFVWLILSFSSPPLFSSFVDRIIFKV